MTSACWLTSAPGGQALQQQHEKAFADMRAYFNSVVRDNLDAIMALKAELSEQKHKEASTAALLQDVVAENQRLTEPLSKVRALACLCLILHFAGCCYRSAGRCSTWMT